MTQQDQEQRITGIVVGRMAPVQCIAPLLRSAQLYSEDPALVPHIKKPWMRAHTARRIGLPIQSAGATEAMRKRKVAAISDFALDRHLLAVGSSGSGKSRFLALLIRAQLRRGCSVVVMDGKGELKDLALYHAQAIGLHPGQVVVVSPQYASVPAWNPNLEGLPAGQAAADFVAVLERTTTGWGHRLQNLVTSALIIIAAHRLSIWELVRMLENDEYRTALLRQVPPDSQDATSAAYREASAFFREEYGQWSKSARTEATGPVLNRCRELLRNDFLLGLLSASNNTLRIADLWGRQRLVVVHLDRSRLGEEGARLLGGLVSNVLLRTALRTPQGQARRKVALVVDEVAVVEHFIGSALSETVAVARSQNLRLLLGTQHLDQLSPALRSACLSNCAVQAFFRVGPDDGRLAAVTIATGAEPRLSRAEVRSEVLPRTDGQLAMAVARHLVRDSRGKRLRIGRATWQRMRSFFTAGSGPKPSPVQCLYALAANYGIRQLFVRAPDGSGVYEIQQYAAGLPPSEVWIEGPDPVVLAVSYPRPRFNGIERIGEPELVRFWCRALGQLPARHCVLRVLGRPGGVIQVVNVPYQPTETLSQFLRASLEANAQTPGAIQRTLAMRNDQVARLAGRGLSRQPERSASARHLRTSPTVEIEPEILIDEALQDDPNYTEEIADDGSLA